MGERIDSLPEWQLGYIAGIIDGEGYIGLIKRGRQDGYKPIVEVGNTNKEVLLTLVDVTYMGEVYPHSVGKTRKDMWRWCIASNTDIYVLLSKILPYLFIKKPQAELIIEYCSSRISKGWFDKCSCYEKLRLLNKRGK